jgi:hypothetical protein
LVATAVGRINVGPFRGHLVVHIQGER